MKQIPRYNYTLVIVALMVTGVGTGLLEQWIPHRVLVGAALELGGLVVIIINAVRTDLAWRRYFAQTDAEFRASMEEWRKEMSWPEAERAAPKDDPQ